MTRSSLPIYIVRSKVDMRSGADTLPLHNLTQPKPRDTSEASTSSTGSSKTGSDVGSQGIVAAGS